VTAAGWDEDMRRFRDALTTVLRAPAAAAGPPGLREPAVALACRDVVLGEVQHLSRTVARALDRPSPDGRLLAAAGKLTRAVQALPASGLGGPPWTRDDRGRPLPVVEVAWWHAAQAAVPLEAYRALGWSWVERDRLLSLLEDTAGFAAALPYLDSDLARRLLDPATPTLRPDGHAGLAAAALTDPARTARLLRAADAVTYQLAGEQILLPAPLARPATGPRLPPDTDGVAGLAESTSHLAAVVRHRHDRVHHAELHALARLLTTGCQATAEVLSRAHPVLPPAGELGRAAQRAGLSCEALQATPVRSLGGVRPEIIRASENLTGRLQLLPRLAARLPAGGGQHAGLLALARPALAWLGAAAQLADASGDALLAAHHAGNLAVPTALLPAGGQQLWALGGPGVTAYVQALAAAAPQALRPVGLAAQRLAPATTPGHHGRDTPIMTVGVEGLSRERLRVVLDTRRVAGPPRPLGTSSVSGPYRGPHR